jgi:hypothetical protein
MGWECGRTTIWLAWGWFAVEQILLTVSYTGLALAGRVEP